MAQLRTPRRGYYFRAKASSRVTTRSSSSRSGWGLRREIRQPGRGSTTKYQLFCPRTWQKRGGHDDAGPPGFRARWKACRRRRPGERRPARGRRAGCRQACGRARGVRVGVGAAIDDAGDASFEFSANFAEAGQAALVFDGVVQQGGDDHFFIAAVFDDDGGDSWQMPDVTAIRAFADLPGVEARRVAQGFDEARGRGRVPRGSLLSSGRDDFHLRRDLASRRNISR